MVTGRIATQAVLVASAFVIPRVLGVEAYGQYAAVMAVILMSQVLSSFGLPMIELRELPPLMRSSHPEQGAVLGSTIWVTRIILSMVAGFAAFAWLSQSEVLVPTAAVLVPLVAVAILRSAFEATRSLLLPLGRVAAFVGFDFFRATLVLVVVVVAFRLAGIDGVFRYFVTVFVVLLPFALFMLHRTLPLRPTSARWGSLRPFVGYSAAAFVGELSVVVQAQFAIFVVAVRIAPEEAGILALTLQLQIVIQGLYLSGLSSLMPILAEFEARQQMRRLRLWGSLMMRYGAAIACVGCVGWALMGGKILEWILSPAFQPVYRTGTVILIGVGFFCCAAACNGLLYIRGLARLASASSLVYAAVTIVGVLTVIGLGPGAALRVTWVYTLAAGLFFLSAYFFLGFRGGLWLPLWRTALLLAPTAIALPALDWSGGTAARLFALAAFIAAYFAGAVTLRLLPTEEIAEIWNTVTGRGQPDAAAENRPPGSS
jgi:O-antigen/teichoic acid export membrane protein